MATRRIVSFDWAIKNILRNKADYVILEGFISELLEVPIKIISILESESNQETADAKCNRVDLLIETDAKERIIIELQTAREYDYFSRILFGTSKVAGESLRSGDEYLDMPKIISINILFFNLGEGDGYLYIGRTTFRDMHTGKILKLSVEERKRYNDNRWKINEHSAIKIKRISKVKSPEDIFPDYYLIKVNRFNEQIRNKFDEWIYFLKTERIQDSFAARGLKEAEKRLQVLNLTTAERNDYNQYEKRLHIAASLAGDARFVQRRLEALEKKLEQAEANFKAKQIKIVKAMKQKGLSVQDIAIYTQLSEAEILDL